MANGKQWINDAGKLTSSDLQEYAEAIKSLKQWEFFRKEFLGTGIFIIGGILDAEIDKRQKEATICQ